jgi:hypothetical protein
MQKAIWAIWYHKASNDDSILHDFCPDGVDSWCAYKKAVSNATQKDFKHKSPVPLPVMNCIKPVFKDLSHPDLLKRCLGGKTQNVNESLNALIWTYCPKTSNSSRKIAEISVNIAVAQFNYGKQATIDIMKELGIISGTNAISAAEEADQQRIKVANKRALNSTLEARIANRRKKKEKRKRIC